ncbi:phosphatase 2C-like domain-containing protein [Halteromyces radiatus]|uniref:phosphatase 2C-like domain-containing protein n=1 Tax=Halteromyces radiatus TaxID=101107 RepID=UPI00221EA549|nr:phosphatase 2C-like domain-containing protein [Halteromyces radiatus]KAI8089595.1 phosphatase 2C-like domain-containing protein [Halteromyces radiatus]
MLQHVHRLCYHIRPKTPFLRHQLTKIFSIQQQRYYYSAAAISQQQEKSRSNLNIIDFFDPDLITTTPHNYTLKCGVSGYAKAGKVVDIPLDEGIYTSVQVGDDAYFVRTDSLGVSDGVGGWRSHSGANPALYSRKLMHYAQLELDRIKTNVRPHHIPQQVPNPVEILENAYHLTTLDAQNEGIVGSTTACIVVLFQDELRVANLGDCGISVIRRNNYIFRSEEQQHSFNFPYQLGTASFDSPMDAQQFTIKVEEGDILILASDGLFDNLYDDEIMEEVQNCIEQGNEQKKGSTEEQSTTIIPIQEISDALAFRAKIVSEDPDNPTSPFQVRAMHEGLYYQGGKADDISVVVAVINRDEKPGPSPPPLP